MLEMMLCLGCLVGRRGMGYGNGIWEWGMGFLDGIGFYYSQMCIGDGFIFN